MKKYFLGCLAAAGAILLGAVQLPAFSQNGGGANGYSPPAAGSAPTTQVSLRTAQGPQGEYLTDARGFSVYVFDADSPGQSNCNGQCSQVWPPLLVSNGQTPTATGDAQNSLIGTIQRSDGSTQVTYNGLPLYNYSLDKNPGDMKGQAINSFGAKWYLVTPAGAKLMPSTYSSSGGNTSPYGANIGAFCDDTGRCCDIYGHCFDGGFTCDRNHQCCDMFGRCYDNTADCDFSGHCCDSQGHCFDNGFSCDRGGHCCDSYGHCYNNGVGGYACDSHGKCCNNSGNCFSFGGGTGCGSISCNAQGHCCDSCGQCYNNGSGGSTGPMPSGTPSGSPSVSPSSPPAPSPAPTSTAMPMPSTTATSAPSGRPSP